MEESESIRVYPPTLFDDCLVWVPVPGNVVMIAIAVTALLALLGAAYFDGIVSRVLESDSPRILLLQPSIAFYILLLQYFLKPSRVAVRDAFRQMMGMDPVEYNRLLVRLSPLTRRGELIALAIGAAIGVALPLEWMLPDQYRWTNLYLTISTWILLALATWGAYSSLAVTQLFNRLHHQELEIDLFHPTFVDAIARRSLGITMAYVGAIALSVFSSRPKPSVMFSTFRLFTRS